MDTLTDKVPVPEHLKDAVAVACSEWQRPLMFSLSERLQDMGLDAHIAVHIEVAILMSWACRNAYLAARVLERRKPDPSRWASACLDEYERTAKWFAENHTDAPPIEVDGTALDVSVGDFPIDGEVWRHTKSGCDYMIAGHIFNTITDKVDVLYRPLYPCEREGFTRQMTGHSKAFISLNEDGELRFHRIKRAGQKELAS